MHKLWFWGEVYCGCVLPDLPFNGMTFWVSLRRFVRNHILRDDFWQGAIPLKSVMPSLFILSVPLSCFLFKLHMTEIE